MAGWILVLEDDPDGRELLAETLQMTGYQVVACADAAEADAAVDRHGKPNVVLTDLLLHGMPGTEYVARLRNRPGLAYVPVIFVTGMDPSMLEEVRDPIVKKPVDLDRLLGLVAEHCPPTTPPVV
jgi:CheY-like chemotaxis protein